MALSGEGLRVLARLILLDLHLGMWYPEGRSYPDRPPPPSHRRTPLPPWRGPSPSQGTGRDSRETLNHPQAVPPLLKHRCDLNVAVGADGARDHKEVCGAVVGAVPVLVEDAVCVSRG